MGPVVVAGTGASRSICSPTHILGGITEVVVDEKTGLLVPPAEPRKLADAVNKILSNKSLAARMGKAGRARVEQHFSWDAIADQTLGLYKKLCAEHQ